MKKIFFNLIIISAVFLASCDRFKGDQEVPAFLKVNKIMLKPDSYRDLNGDIDSGFLTSDIRGVWVTAVNTKKNKEESIGVFELPCSIPILLEGNVEVRLYPVIFQDLNIHTQTVYPFYKSIPEKVNLSQGSETVLDSIIYTEYNLDASKIAWYENFEGVSMSFDDTSIVKIESPAKSGKYSGLIHFKNSDSVVLCSFESFELLASQRGSGLYLEFDYWTKDILYMGIQGISNENSSYILTYPKIIQIPTVKDNSTPYEKNKWRKIYIPLYETWYNYFDLNTKFSVAFFAKKKNNGEYSGIYLDNIKLLHSK